MILALLLQLTLASWQLQAPQSNVPPGSPIDLDLRARPLPAPVVLEPSTLLTISSVHQKDGNTTVTLAYPKGLGDRKVWACVQERIRPAVEPADQMEGVTMWCGGPTAADSETQTLPRWPDPVERGAYWQVRGFVQWFEPSDSNSPSGYQITDWRAVVTE